jgi:hypothetical protein
LYAFSLFGIVIALALFIPLSIVLGQWARGGPVTVASIGAGLGFTFFWVVTITYSSQSAEGITLTSLPSLIGGALLTFAAWALALADALRARRWGWLAAVWIAVYVTIAAMYFMVTTPVVSCIYTSSIPYYCASQSRIFYWLIVAGCFVGPAVLLAYALRHATRAQPDGLSASPLDGANAPAQTRGAH